MQVFLRSLLRSLALGVTRVDFKLEDLLRVIFGMSNELLQLKTVFHAFSHLPA
jgi:hypothetical protein